MRLLLKMNVLEKKGNCPTYVDEAVTCCSSDGKGPINDGGAGNGKSPLTCFLRALYAYLHRIGEISMKFVSALIVVLRLLVGEGSGTVMEVL